MAGAGNIFPTEISMKALMLMAFHTVKESTPGTIEQPMKAISLKE